MRRSPLLALAVALGCAPAARDPCDPNPCAEPGRTACVDSGGAAECRCDHGLREVAGACLPPDPCDPNPCTAPNEGVCTAAGGAFTCGCDPGHIPAEDGCRPEPPITCDAQHAAGDPFEPDECPALARDIGSGGGQQEPHSILPADDADWLRAGALAREVFELHAVPEIGLSLRADVYSSDALLPLGATRTGPGELRFRVRAPAAGPLYFRLRGADASATGAYSVSLWSVGLDEFGDLPEEATPIPLDVPATGAFQFVGDADVARFEAGAGRSYAVEASSAQAGAPLSVRLLRGAPAFDRRSGLGEQVRLVFRSAAAEPHWVWLSPSNRLDTQGWQLRVEDLGPDDHGDDALDATPALPTGQPQAASLERPGDRDAFRFDATSGRIYAFSCSPIGFSDCHLTLLDPGGNVVAADADGGLARIVREFVPGGRHLVLVDAPAGAVGQYSWTLEDLGTDDHGDAIASATVVTLPPENLQQDPCLILISDAELETPGDKDVLSFTVYADHVIRFGCTRAGLSDCNLRLLDAAGTELAVDADGGDGTAWIEDVGGQTYFLELSSPTGTGAYKWSLLDVCHDDHRDTIANATLMSANSAFVAGELEMPGDVDAFYFAVQGGRTYRVSCTRQALPDCHLRLFDGAGTLLSTDVDGADAVLLHAPSAAGELRFEISGDGGMGTYLVKAEDLGP